LRVGAHPLQPNLRVHRRPTGGEVLGALPLSRRWRPPFHRLQFLVRLKIRFLNRFREGNPPRSPFPAPWPRFSFASPDFRVKFRIVSGRPSPTISSERRGNGEIFFNFDGRQQGSGARGRRNVALPGTMERGGALHGFFWNYHCLVRFSLVLRPFCVGPKNRRRDRRRRRFGDFPLRRREIPLDNFLPNWYQTSKRRAAPASGETRAVATWAVPSRPFRFPPSPPPSVFIFQPNLSGCPKGVVYRWIVEPS
jgi:hypothetical protein